MFYRYEIRKKGTSRVLYIFLSSTLEEANEFVKKDDFSIEDKIMNFIKNNNINYNDGPVYIISNGIIIKSIDIHNKSINIEELIGTDIYNNKNFIVKIEKNNVLNVIKLEDFLLVMLLNLDQQLQRTYLSCYCTDKSGKCLSIVWELQLLRRLRQQYTSGSVRN